MRNLQFNEDKPSVVPILKTDKLNVFAIGLLKDQLLKKHKTPLLTILVVLKGEIEFRINNEKIRLQHLDTYSIPVNIEHEVIGIGSENIFMLTQEK